MLEMRNQLPSSWKAEYDDQISKQLIEITQKQKAKTIHCYIPIHSEVDCTLFINEVLQYNSTVVVSKTLENRKLEHIELHSISDLEKGKFGTKHPKSGIPYTGQFDMIIVPALAFDYQHYRLGYGGGYYDGFLAQHPEALTIGLCYPFQYIDQIPRESHDAQVNRVLLIAQD